MKNRLLILFIGCCTLLSGCIGTDYVDDFVEPRLTITNDVAMNIVVVDIELQLETIFRNTIGQIVVVNLDWTSVDPTIATVDQNGLVTGKNVGETAINASYTIDGIFLEATFPIIVVSEVEPILVLNQFIDTLGANDSFQFIVQYRDQDGLFNDVAINWTSSDETIATVDVNGLVIGRAIGNAILTASYNDGSNDLMLTHDLAVKEETVVMLEQRTGSINTTSSYDLKGDFILTEEEDGSLTLSLASNYDADTGLPGLYVYLTNNRNSNGSAVAYEIGKVSVFNGEHSYTIAASEGISLNQYQYVLYYCKPFSVKVGDGLINE